ncbi:MAG: 4Fe-4S binding protein [Deltaproteobacteria bacterium]|nr:4Fe-4S binding protein [Deltaproteobacteria bacterium]
MKIDLLKNHTLNHLLKKRPFQLSLQVPFVLLFALLVFAGLYGTSLGSNNIATVITWTIWWGGLIFTFPLIGRAWCLVCPWAAISDWVQRLAFWKKKEIGLALDKKFPIWLRNMYPVIISFLIITWAEFYFSAVSNPKNTAYIAIIFLIAAVLISIIFERRSFCRYLCPIGGMIGVYSRFSFLELRARDKVVCRACNTKDCINGNEKGYGCPVFEYPEAMDTNTYCVLCTECIKTCPKDNIALNLRPITRELSMPADSQLDESLMILAAFAIVIFHGITMIPPWFQWTDLIMLNTGIEPYALVTIALFTFVMITIFIYSIFVFFTPHSSPLTPHPFIAFAYPLIPLALFFHLSHNVFHLFGEGKNLIIVSSDPFGWGWNLFGTRGLKLEPIISFNMIYYLEIALAMIGFIYAIYLTYKTSLQDFEGKGLVSMTIMILCLTVIYIIMLNQPMVMRMG